LGLIAALERRFILIDTRPESPKLKEYLRRYADGGELAVVTL